MVAVQAAMSLDGFIADENDRVGPLFDWYDNGPVAFTGTDPHRVFHVSAATADYLGRVWSQAGVSVIGRRLFDLTNGWGGVPPAGHAVVVMTHQPPTDWPFPDAPYHFVTDGIEAAVALATELADGKQVAVNAGNIAGQAFTAGLVDEVLVDLVPVVFGRGKRFFGDHAGSPLMLADPEIVVGDRVLHLRFAVDR